MKCADTAAHSSRPLVFDWIAAGDVKVTIGGVYPPGEAARAQRLAGDVALPASGGIDLLRDGRRRPARHDLSQVVQRVVGDGLCPVMTQ
jgi:hypothetical protein